MNMRKGYICVFLGLMGFFWTFFFPLTEDILRIQNQLSLLLLQFVQPFFIKWLDYSSRTPYLYASALILHMQLVKRWWVESGVQELQQWTEKPWTKSRLNFLSLFMRFIHCSTCTTIYIKYVCKGSRIVSLFMKTEWKWTVNWSDIFISVFYLCRTFTLSASSVFDHHNGFSTTILLPLCLSFINKHSQECWEPNNFGYH